MWNKGMKQKQREGGKAVGEKERERMRKRQRGKVN
jgi:hypothetical protein